MSLQLSKNTDYGVAATYWRVAAARFDFNENTLSVDISGYASAASFQAGNNPLAGETIVISITTDPRSAIETYLMTQTEWAGATEVS